MDAQGIALALYVALGAGWIGYGLGYREARAHFEPTARVGKWVWTAVTKVRETRKFAGCGLEVIHTAGMITPDGKRYKVSVEEDA